MTQQQGHGLVFDRAAADFDRLGRYLWYPIGSATVALTAPTTGERVLDACCGNGASALPAAERVGPEGTVDAVDLSDDLLANLELCGHSLPQLRTHRTDVTVWEPGGYDVLQCVLGIFFFPDMEAGTRHLISCVRPGGRVGFTIWRRGSMAIAERHLQLAIDRVTGSEHEKRPEHLYDRVNDANSCTMWLESLGLEQVRVVESPLTVPMSPEIAWLLVTGSGFIGKLSGLTQGQIEDVRQAYLRSLAEAGVSEIDATTLIGLGIRAAPDVPRTESRDT
ncbi:MAG: class I SAM-dependent methyltransferase [Microbacterium sp.]